MLKRLWREDEGVLTFEWILLLTLLVIGVIGGVAGIRDAIIHECQGICGAMISLDQGYYIAAPLGVGVSSVATGGTSGSNANCTSSASGGTMFQDSANWATGRMNGGLLGNLPQTTSTTMALCPLP